MSQLTGEAAWQEYARLADQLRDLDHEYLTALENEEDEELVDALDAKVDAADEELAVFVRGLCGLPPHSMLPTGGKQRR